MFYDTALASWERPELHKALRKEESPYLNRELSWMAFNERVLEEARDHENPLYERLNFLGITVSNLDEFFMIRVASLLDLIQAGSERPDPAGLSPRQQLKLLMEDCQQFYRRQYSTYKRQILPALNTAGLTILSAEEILPEQRAVLERYFTERIFPVLSPLAVDASHPFPQLATKTLNLLVLLRENARSRMRGSEGYAPFAIVQVPSNLPRLIRLAAAPGETMVPLILLEDVIRLFIDRLFDNQKILSCSAFRIERDADFDIDDDEVSDLLLEIEEHVKGRQRGSVIRLELEEHFDAEGEAILRDILKVPEGQIFSAKGPLDLGFVTQIPALVPREDLLFMPFSPQPAPAFYDASDPFAVIREHDVLLHHPYESFAPVVEIIQRAARDPHVLAIKQTLYRVSGQSPIVQALADAANAGKQVLVLVELKARFDEERNIHWARKLEEAGCHVLYGLRGLKTHSKITLIVREEEDGLRRYVHVATGNYNDKTARIYTDIGIWTTRERMGEDASDFFNMLSGYSLPLRWKHFIPAPRWLRSDLLYRVQQESRHAAAGEKAMIVIKCNAVLDPEMMAALYEASGNGVIIRMIVRGISCLRPAVKGLSENMEVRSIVGRFLEHSRIFYFYNQGKEDLFIGSADWMTRNLDRRIELVIPVLDEVARRRVFQVLELELADTDRARIEDGDGVYKRVDRRGKQQLDSQLALINEAIRAFQSKQPDPSETDHYEPQMAEQEL